MTTSGSALSRKRKKPRPTSQKIASCMISRTLTPRKFDPSRWDSSCGNTLSEGEIAALTTSMRQIGVRTPGGEALAIFHQLLCDEWMTGSLSGPLARIKVDEKHCFGMIEWQAVREAAARFLPKHTAAEAWEHRNVSFVEQEGLSPMPNDRGAEQGDVDGPWSAAWRREEALPHGRRRAPFLGLA